MFKLNYKNLISNTLILMLVLGGSIVISTPKSAYAYVSKAEYTITETDLTSGNQFGTNGANGNNANTNGSNGNNSNPNGNGNNQNTVPSIGSIGSNSGEINSGEKVVTINGKGFTPNSIARFDGSNRPTAFIDSSRLQMKVLASDLKNAGAHRISVLNPNGGFSNAVAYNVLGAGAVKGANTSSNNNNTEITQNSATSNKKVVNLILDKDTDYRISYADNANGIYSNSDTVAYGNEYYGNQSANALSASSKSNFLPNTLFEWLILIFLIFLGVFIWRKATRTEEEKHAPLKHD